MNSILVLFLSCFVAGSFNAAQSPQDSFELIPYIRSLFRPSPDPIEQQAPPAPIVLQAEQAIQKPDTVVCWTSPSGKAALTVGIGDPNSHARPWAQNTAVFGTDKHFGQINDPDELEAAKRMGPQYWPGALCVAFYGGDFSMSRDKRIDFITRFTFYPFWGFRDYVTSLPEFDEMAISIYNQCQMDRDFKKKMDKAWGFQKGGLTAYFAQKSTEARERIARAEDLQRQKKEQELQAQRKTKELAMRELAKAQEQQQQKIQEYCIGHENETQAYEALLQNELSTNTQDLVRKKKLEARASAIVQAANNRYKIELKTYQLSAPAERMLKEAGIPLDSLNKCLGNSMQQIAHQEIVDILTQSADIHYNQSKSQEFKSIALTVVDFAQVSHDYNRSGFSLQSYSINDFCDYLLGTAFGQIGSAAVRGFSHGAGNVLLHPVDTITGVVTFPFKAAACLYSLLQETGALEKAAGDLFYAVQKMSAPELVERGTALITEAALTGKLLGSLGKFAKLASAQRLKLDAASVSAEVAVVTGEGIAAKVFADVEEFAALAKSEGTEKVSNVLKLVQHDAEFAQLGTERVKEFTRNLGRPDQYKTLLTGEKCRIMRPKDDFFASTIWADKKWEEIRNLTDDVQKIALNTGMAEHKIQRIKNHVFFDEHIRNEGAIKFIARFEGSPDMIEAWDRLYRGDFIGNDLKLLHHEYFESRYERMFKTTYQEAHDATQKSKGRPWYEPE